VRIALGASRRRVISLVLREAVLLLAIGLTLGMAFSVWAGQVAAFLVYGMTPRRSVDTGGRGRIAGVDRAVCQLWAGMASLPAATH
jgi:ABC-type antimicrobial peptide transport system permease subunit